MGSIVLKSLSVLLGLFFIFVGILKISCFLSKDLHRDLVSTIQKINVNTNRHLGTNLQVGSEFIFTYNKNFLAINLTRQLGYRVNFGLFSEERIRKIRQSIPF